MDVGKKRPLSNFIKKNSTIPKSKELLHCTAKRLQCNILRVPSNDISIKDNKKKLNYVDVASKADDDRTRSAAIKVKFMARIISLFPSVLVLFFSVQVHDIEVKF